MRTKIIEGVSLGGLYLKAIVGRFDQSDWARRSEVSKDYNGMNLSLLRREGWQTDHFVILDISHPGPGGIFKMGGNARADLQNSPTTF